MKIHPTLLLLIIFITAPTAAAHSGGGPRFGITMSLEQIFLLTFALSFIPLFALYKWGGVRKLRDLIILMVLATGLLILDYFYIKTR